MAADLDFEGFLDGGFLDGPFLAGVGGQSQGSQVALQIVDRTQAVGQQAELTIVDALKVTGSQAALSVAAASANVPAQVELAILDFLKAIGSQVSGTVDDRLVVLGLQLASSNILYQACGGFLDDPFLSGPFLGRCLEGHLRSQVHLQIQNLPHAVGSQAEGTIAAAPHVAMQTKLRIVDATKAIGCQVLLLRAHALGCSIRFVLYNTDKPRVLCEFPSRGADGLTWSANSTQPGDFSPNNLNNDVVEFYWRSAQGTTSGVILTCDTQVPQGIFVDTFAMLEHNLTKGATVTFQGSNDPAFGAVGFETTLPATLRNTFWVLPQTLFASTGSYRYWRLLINDLSNPDGHVRAGTIVFGPSVIFQGECAEQRIRMGKTHFKSANETEGYTSADQDLALKKRVTINFPNMDARRYGNYDALQEIFDFARTSLKCLWMVDPRPTYIDKFSIFGKISSLPDEDHNVITEDEFRASFSVEIDEAK